VQPDCGLAGIPLNNVREGIIRRWLIVPDRRHGVSPGTVFGFWRITRHHRRKKPPARFTFDARATMLESARAHRPSA